MEKQSYQQFSDADMEAFASPMALGVLATVNDEEQPHMTCITTLQACDSKTLIWGQFAEGLSKQFIRSQPRVGFFIITPDGHFWRGRAEFTHTATCGAEYDMYNDQPMFRYNAYFGVHTVYYMNLVESYGRETLPKFSLLYGAMQSQLARQWARNESAKQVMNPWTQSLIGRFSNLKVLCYVTDDGYPVMIPVIQACPFDAERIGLTRRPYREELDAITENTTVAFWAMSKQLENVLIRGQFHHKALLNCAQINVDWVYNSMPPVPQMIYPQLAIKQVKQFKPE